MSITKKFNTLVDLLNNGNLSCYRKPYKRTFKRLVISTVYDETSKRNIQKSEFKTIDRKSEMKNYSVTDFCLENILSLNKELSSVTLEPSRFTVLQQFENL